MNRPLYRAWWLLLIIPMAIGLARLRFDVDVLNLLPGEIPVVRGLQLFQKHFNDTRELVITLRAADPDAAASAARQMAESLRRETNLVASAVWQPPWQEDQGRIAQLIAYLWLNQPPEAFAQLTNRLAPDRRDAVLRETREQLATTLSPTDIARLSYDPFGLTRLPETGMSGSPTFGDQSDGFASEDGRFRVVFVEAHHELSSFRACAAWFGKIKEVINSCERSPDWPLNATVRFTGSPAFVTEIATGMERDVKLSVLTTLVLIAGLFWWAHRSWRPLLWLLALLGLVVAGTLACGGLIFGKLNAVSLGFAAILLGLAVDYGLVLYQESLAAPHVPLQGLRRTLAPSILWSAVTTATAFTLLNFVGLPGLSQLGSLVAIGVLLAAGTMLYAFLPLVLRKRTTSSSSASKIPASMQAAADSDSRKTGNPEMATPRPQARPALPLIVTGIIAVLAAVTLWRSWPPVDHGTGALQPKHLAAQTAFDELQLEMNRQGEPLLLVVSGRDESEVARRLDAVSEQLLQATIHHDVASVTLPTALWPHPERRRINATAAAGLVNQADAIKAAAAQAGFTSDALALTEGVFRSWKTAAESTGAIWPTNQSCQWLLKRAAAWTGEDWLAVGTVYPGIDGDITSAAPRLTPAIPGVWLTAWPLLGDALLNHVEHRLQWVMTAMIMVVALCLWLAFGRLTEVLLSFATVGFSLLVLLMVMGLAGWTWNLMNLTAVPLLLGAGVDYTIHIQLALRRNAGNISRMRQITGRAVFLCAATTAVGFGSNALSGNAGLASLGMVCAIGIAATFLTAVFLLPAWWHVLRVCNPDPHWRPGSGAPEGGTPNPDRATPAAPSSFYRAGVWSFGLILVRILPMKVCEWLGRGVAAIYYLVHPRRREVVIQNLLPVFSGDRERATHAARKLFQEFAVKIIHLWRYESGVPVEQWLAEWHGWDIFAAACARGRGVLLITPHLGNWEFGGAFLAHRGMKLLVLTQAEPEQRLTELRQDSRARWGIETLVVGEDAFAFVEIIKRLQAGAIVALLVDRPPPPTATMVEMFGQPFHGSIAAAELARASGCALIPAVVVRKSGGYLAEILPEISYDRAAIGDRAGRMRLTQEILRAFEPAIRQHVEQWYHFVPIWP